MAKIKDLVVVDAATARSITDQIGAAASLAKLDGNHAAHAALDDLHQILHQLKVRASNASNNLAGDDAELVARLLQL